MMGRPGFCRAQLVEKPGCTLRSNRVSGIFAEESVENQEMVLVVPPPCCQLFQVHGSKLKLHPVCHLCEASVLCITHCVFFFCICKNTFNRLFAFSVKLLARWRISGVICQFLIVLPDMPLHCFDTVLGMGTQFSGRAVGAFLRIALVFPVSVSVCSAVF